MPIRRAMYGLSMFGQDMFGGRAEGLKEPDIEEDLFQLDVRNKNNVRLAELPNWGSGAYTKTINAPSEIEFTYSYDDAQRQHLVYPNIIGVYDQYGDLTDRLRILKRAIVDEDGSRYVRIYGRDLLAQLGREKLVSFEATDETVLAIVQSLLSKQVFSNVVKVHRGTIAHGIGGETRSLSFENQSILAGLLRLQCDGLGGMFYVDEKGYFQWVRDFPYTGQRIEVGKNLPSLEVTEDYTPLATRVTVYGQGATPSTRLSATKNNTTAQSTYGIVLHTESYPDISDETWLANRATELVRQLSRVQKEVKVSVLDLSLADQRLDYSQEAINTGRRVTLIDGAIDTTLETRIKRLQRDMAVPVRVAIECMNPADLYSAAGFGDGVAADLISVGREDRNILHTIADLMDKIRAVTERDPGFETSILNTLWNTTTHAGSLDESLIDLFANDTTTLQTIVNSILNDPTSVNNIADTTMGDMIDAIEANSQAIQDLADALVGDTDALAALEAAIGGNTISSSTPVVCTTGAGTAGTTGDVSDSGHRHQQSDNFRSLFTGTPADDTTNGDDGSRSDVAKGDHSHRVPKYK